MTTLTIRAPDDFHIHLRDGDALTTTVAHAHAFARILCMPNLVPPIVNVNMAQDYRTRVLAYATDLMPYFTLYLTDTTSIDDIKAAADCEFILGIKLYPLGATTNSDKGVSDIKARYGVFEKMADLGVPLLVHGEVNQAGVDIFDQERVFYDTILSDIRQTFPHLKIICEHITTSEAADFVRAHDNTFATITPQHLLFHRNDMLKGGIRPHFYCLPILKRERHQVALLDAATSGNPKFFAGTDSAPHPTHAKESACGCAGCYTAPFAISLYASAFDKMNALDKLENFISVFGARAYGLPPNERTITLHKIPHQIPSHYPYMNSTLTPFLAGETLDWQAI